jgi:hypothetical protein
MYIRVMHRMGNVRSNTRELFGDVQRTMYLSDSKDACLNHI